jgi:exodeoxyribonuclease VII small subunit
LYCRDDLCWAAAAGIHGPCFFAFSRPFHCRFQVESPPLAIKLDEFGWIHYLGPMSKAGKTTASANASEGNEVPFEEALKKLEAIVASMESDDLPLETLIARFEEGTRLSQICQAKLAEAELKIQQLEKNAAGELAVTPLTLSDSSTSA